MTTELYTEAAQLAEFYFIWHVHGRTSIDITQHFLKVHVLVHSNS